MPKGVLAKASKSTLGVNVRLLVAILFLYVFFCKMQLKKKRRQLESVQGPVDRSKVCMRDLIYMNPVNNPMK